MEQMFFPFCVSVGCHGVASPEDIGIWVISILGVRGEKI